MKFLLQVAVALTIAAATNSIWFGSAAYWFVLLLECLFDEFADRFEAALKSDDDE